MKLRSRQASAALALFLLGCAGAGPDAGAQDLERVRSEVRALRADNERLRGELDALERRVDFLSVRGRPRAGEPRDGAPAAADAAPAPVVPPDLAVVKVSPPRGARSAPPVPTAVPIAEPDAERIEALARRSGRELAADADAELAAARARDGLDRAHGLEDFVARYPRHPAADDALVEASSAYAAAGHDEAACALARRATDDYPAGGAVSDALERLASCESHRGDADAERRLLQRLVNDYPRSPAAERAGARLAATQRSGP